MKGVAVLTLVLVALIFLATPVAANHQPAGVEINIWMHGGTNITPIKTLEASLGITFDGAKWYENWDDPWRPWILANYHNNGYQPEMTWQPMLKQADGSFLGVANTDILAGKYNSYLDSMSANIKALPYRLRISYAAEFNGFWNPWAVGKVGNTTANFVTSWRYIVDRFRANNVTNVDWIWAPNVDPDHIYQSYGSMYPGNNYVTYFGLDGYNWGTGYGGTWKTFREVFQISYNDLQALSPKDVYIMEVSSVEQGGSKAQWIKDMFDDLEGHFPKIKGITWFNVAYPQWDWRLQTSGSAMAAFGAGVNGPAAAGGGNGLGTGSGTGTVGGGHATATDPNAGGASNAAVPASGSITNSQAPANYTPKNDTKRSPVHPPPINTEQADTGFNLPRILNGEKVINPNIIVGTALALVIFLVTFCYFVTRRILRHAKKIDAIAEAEQIHLEEIAHG